MSFKHPEIFYFLFLALIPLIVHLFKRRKFVKTSFTNVAFLKKIDQENRKSSQVKKLLLLTLRTISILAILFAFSQPFLSDKKLNNTSYNFIYLDNSYSLSASGMSGNLLNFAKQSLIENVPKKEKYTLLTNDNLYSELSYNEFKEILISIDFSANQLNLDEITLQFNREKNKKTNSLYRLVNITDLQNFKYGKFTNVKQGFSVIKLNSTTFSNISIDSIYKTFENTEEVRIEVVIKNQGIEKSNVPYAIYDKNKLLNKQTFSVDADSEINLEFSLPYSSDISGIIKIPFSDTFLFDNELFFSLNASKRINILSIGNSSNFLKRIYPNDEFNVEQVNLESLSYDNILNQDVVILNELESIPVTLQKFLSDYLKSNGTLVVIPKESIELNSYNNLLNSFELFNVYSNIESRSSKITTINFNHPLLENVFEKEVSNFDYPSVNTSINLNENDISSILKFNSGKSFLAQANTKGKLYLFSAALNDTNSNFLKSPLIVPLFYNFAAKSFLKSNLYQYLQENKEIDIETKVNKDQVLMLKQDENQIIPLQQTFQNKVRINVSNSPRKKGFYKVIREKDTIQTLAFNIPKSESNLNFLNVESGQIANPNIIFYNSIEDYFKTIIEKNEVKWLWKWFFWIAIVSLLLEILLLKFLKP